MWFTRRILAACLSAAVLLLLAGVSFAAPISPENAFRSAFPQVPFDSMTPTEIKGVYEVVSGPNIFYYYPEKDLILTGEIVGKDLKSRTAERKQALSSQVAAKAMEAVKELPLDKAVKVGDGKKTVIEFTDPDCPYCRKASEYFTKRSDVTRYVFFAPLAHPAAIKKIEYILSAENKAEAYDAMMLGEEIPASAKPASAEVKKLAQEHLALARKVGIQGTPTFFVKGEQVIGADTKKLDELLK
ncbi:protein disulfide bond isomerase, DsbC/DsbG-like protein [Citrifermentans bemidjiense Bem]|uniref:Protein disulfide bond isomerase, DsbC/DsbG-like protein n=1 Tax=Citrifermentans bemidjiense (strain ATCC BAA-1014 / DSM 16622 / JCM 12645 / Bem) TaxID=404380 RepID=B5EI82_CITBB|nr:DsbC family protein [Citrifermentans bemidjiense]ACH38346.1 protein disulfide bond isomerase, DsbC/DsbG-like protein [Citrifermentans bemidjiense Bem]